MYRDVITCEEFLAAYEKTGLKVTNSCWLKGNEACALGVMYAAEGGERNQNKNTTTGHYDLITACYLCDFLKIPYEDSTNITLGFQRGLMGMDVIETIPEGRTKHAYNEAYKAGLKLKKMGKSPY